MNKVLGKAIVEFILSIALFVLLMVIFFVLPQWIQNWAFAILIVLGSMVIINPLVAQMLKRIFSQVE